MKILNLKSGFFGLFAIIAVSLVMTSCAKEEILTDEFTDVIEQKDGESAFNMMMPAEMSEEEAKIYMISMTNEEITAAAKEFTTMNYLKANNKLEQFQDHIAKNGNLNGATLSDHLSSDELAALRAELSGVTPQFISSRCNEYRCFYYYHIVGGTLYIKKYCYWI